MMVSVTPRMTGSIVGTNGVAVGITGDAVAVGKGVALTGSAVGDAVNVAVDGASVGGWVGVGVGVVMAKVGALTAAKQTAVSINTANIPRSVLRIIA